MRFHFVVFTLGTICLTACSSTPSNPPVAVQQASKAHAHPIQYAKNFSCVKSECIYVTNPVVNPPAIGGSIDVYPANANGNVAPVQVISGAATGLTSPWGVAVDKKHNIYAGNNNFGYQATPSITIYPAGTNGNKPPMKTITSTQLFSPTALTVNSKYQIYVDDAPGNTKLHALRVFARNASGNWTQIRAITGNNTLISSPVGVALYRKVVYVLNQGNVNQVALLSFGATGTGNIAPGTNVAGGTAFTFPYADGVAVSSAGTAYVVNHPYFVDQWGCPTSTSVGGGQVVGFPYGATGNVAPTVTISGNLTGFISPCSDAVDKAGRIYVTDTAANAIYVFAANANGNVAPIQVIQGPNTQLANPEDIAVF